jgi:hypothetical protein
LDDALQYDVPLQPLLQLTGLLQLKLPQQLTGDVAGVLAQMTNLRVLDTGQVLCTQHMLFNACCSTVH